MTIVWSTQAVDDLEEAVAHIATENRASAAKVANALFSLVERLATEPLDGPEHLLRDGQIVRGWPCPPFRLYYQRSGGDLLVVRIYHQRRKPIER